eukprot:2741615-Prymnesium_polylepis.1
MATPRRHTHSTARDGSSALRARRGWEASPTPPTYTSTLPHTRTIPQIHTAHNTLVTASCDAQSAVAPLCALAGDAQG